MEVIYRQCVQRNSGKIVNRDNEIAWSRTQKGLMSNAPSVRFAKAEDVENIYTVLGYTTDYKVKKDWIQVKLLEDEGVLSAKKRNVKKENITTQLIGATIKDAVFLLEKLEYRVVPKGVGKVSRITLVDKTAYVELKN